jgi:DNA polymerase elongation subunit (family B)
MIELEELNEDYLNNLTKEELDNLLSYLKQEQKRYYNYEQAIKLTLNSIYGAFGNEYFYFFDVRIAESITLQGQDAILYAEEMLNRYFFEIYHKDKKLHKLMGIEVVGQIQKPAGIYIDTDSVYVSFDEAIKISNWTGTEKEFIQDIYKYRLKEYIELVLGKYAEAHNCDNFLNFELESIAKNAIWLAKKKYIQNIVWTDPDIHFEDLTNLKSKGFEIIQSSTPLFARKRLGTILKYIFAEGSDGQINMSNIVKLLKKVKKEFHLSNIEHLTQNLKINNYQKYISNDYDEFVFEKRCPVHLRGAGYHNYLLNNSQYKNKYELVTDGEKIKMYYSKDKDCNVFSFKAGEYPREFAPEMDYDLQFEKSIIDPINRVLAAVGLQTLDRNLIYTSSLF